MISYIGGKKFHSKWINPFLPKECNTYIEVFGGAFWIHFMTNINSKKVIYNDINSQLANLFSCVSQSPERLLKNCEQYSPQDNITFNTFRDELFNNEILITPTFPDFEMATKFVYCQTQIFSGNTLLHKTKMTHLKGKYKSKYEHFMDKLNNPKYIKKMKQITNVENLPFEDIISKYDNENSFFYIDPPYYGLESYYTHSDCDHQKLMDILIKLKGKFALSYYDFPLLRETFPVGNYHWVERDVIKQNGNRKQEKSSKGIEVLIMNYKNNSLF